MFLSQITLRTLPAEFWAATAAFITGAVLIAKKVLTRKDRPKPEYISRTEFHDGLDKVRDRIGASYLALSDKLDLNQRDVLAAVHRLATTTERRLDTLDSAVARLDERTKLSSSSSSSSSSFS